MVNIGTVNIPYMDHLGKAAKKNNMSPENSGWNTIFPLK